MSIRQQQNVSTTTVLIKLELTSLPSQQFCAGNKASFSKQHSSASSSIMSLFHFPLQLPNSRISFEKKTIFWNLFSISIYVSLSHSIALPTQVAKKKKNWSKVWTKHITVAALSSLDT